MKEAVVRARALAPAAPSSGSSDGGSSAVGPPNPFSWGYNFTGLDGAFFGPTFPHLLGIHAPEQVFRFLRAQPPHPEHAAAAAADRPADAAAVAADARSYVPRIHGFRVHNQRGPVRRGVGDALGLYATALVGVPPLRDASAAVAAGDGGRTRGRGGDADASPAVAAAAAAAAGDGPAAPGPLVPVASAALADAVRAGAPPIPAPLVWPVPGIPGGIPVYGEAAASAASSRAGWPGEGRCVEHGGVSYLVMRPSGVPLTSVYPRGQKPLDDDFTDGEGEEAGGGPVGAPDAAANRKRRRKT